MSQPAEPADHQAAFRKAMAETERMGLEVRSIASEFWGLPMICFRVTELMEEMVGMPLVPTAVPEAQPMDTAERFLIRAPPFNRQVVLSSVMLQGPVRPLRSARTRELFMDLPLAAPS